jgi:hypothetical protein
VELGYLSNAKDVQSLSSPEWQTKTAAAMIQEIDAFFAGPGKPDNGPSAESGVASPVVQATAPSAH